MSEFFDYKAVGARVRSLRGAERQKDWARKIGCDQGYVSQVENGVTKPSLAFLGVVSSISSVSIDWILTGNGLKKTFDAREPDGERHDPEVSAAVDGLLQIRPAGRTAILTLGGLDSERVEALVRLVRPCEE